MSRFADVLKSGRFAVTAELNPPKGTDLAPLLRKARMLKGIVGAFNLTDSHASRMGMAPVTAAHRLLDEGVEPILQLTCRDRNRLALHSDLLAVSTPGISNLLGMSGNDPSIGDHPDAKPVFDLGAVTLLNAVSTLQAGRDLGGNELAGAPAFFAGAVANPEASDIDRELRRMEERIAAGAGFFQTQSVYDPVGFERFMNTAHRYNVPVLAGFIMLKSGNMAGNLNANIPGITVPDAMVRELDEAEDRRRKSVEIAARIIEAIGWESRIPEVMEQAGVMIDR